MLQMGEEKDNEKRRRSIRKKKIKQQQMKKSSNSVDIILITGLVEYWSRSLRKYLWNCEQRHREERKMKIKSSYKKVGTC